jgi:hypothetical protein
VKLSGVLGLDSENRFLRLSTNRHLTYSIGGTANVRGRNFMPMNSKC